MVYLKDYNLDYLKDYFRNYLIDNSYIDYLEEVLKVMIKNNYRINKHTLSIYNYEGFQEGYSYGTDVEKIKKDVNFDILLEFKGQVNNNCSRLKRGFKAY